MIIFEIRIFKLSDIDQGIYKHAMQKKKEFLACLKKLSSGTGKNPIFVYLGLRYAEKKLKFACNFFWKMFVWVQKMICG